MRVAWGKRVSIEFTQKVIHIADKFGWTEDHINWLMACMAFETGETFSPTIKNAAGSGAVGLIQFMPATAKDLGTRTSYLEDMTAEEQLDYVSIYFRPYSRMISSLSDMYMAILMPRYVGYRDDSVLFCNSVAYRQNSGLDANHDGKITKLEATEKVASKLAKGLRPGYVLEGL